jgi:Predicted membrane protein
MQKKFSQTDKIVISAIFLAMALIIGRFRIVVPYAGVPFLKITFSGPLYKFIAIIFGPVYGGIIPALADFIGATIDPIGNYIWMFTAVAFIKGFLIGLIWKCTEKFRNNDNKLWFYIALIISVSIPDFISSVLNTFIMKLYLLLPEKSFFIILISRLCKEFFMTIFNIIILAIIINVYEKIIVRGGSQ